MAFVPRFEKRLIDPSRLRRIPSSFSWIDRRFVREGWIERLSRDEILLYFFLVTVADREGLSYYSDARTSATLKIPLEALLRARQRLLDLELVAYQAPLYQVLDFARPEVARRCSEPESIGSILHHIRASGNPDSGRTPSGG